MKNLKLLLAIILSSYALHGMDPLAKLRAAEEQCDPRAYQEALSKSLLLRADWVREPGEMSSLSDMRREAWAKSSLIDIIRQCALSGKLRELVTISLQHTGQLSSDPLGVLAEAGGNHSQDVENDIIETANLLIAHTKKPIDFFSPLHKAVKNGSIVAAKVFLEAGANPDESQVGEWDQVSGASYFASAEQEADECLEKIYKEIGNSEKLNLCKLGFIECSAREKVAEDDFKKRIQNLSRLKALFAEYRIKNGS